MVRRHGLRPFEFVLEPSEQRRNLRNPRVQLSVLRVQFGEFVFVGPSHTRTRDRRVSPAIWTRTRLKYHTSVGSTPSHMRRFTYLSISSKSVVFSSGTDVNSVFSKGSVFVMSFSVKIKIKNQPFTFLVFTWSSTICGFGSSDIANKNKANKYLKENKINGWFMLIQWRYSLTHTIKVV